MNHVKQFKCKAVGRPTVLTADEEEVLVHTLVKLGDWDYGFEFNCSVVCKILYQELIGQIHLKTECQAQIGV